MGIKQLQVDWTIAQQRIQFKFKLSIIIERSWGPPNFKAFPYQLVWRNYAFINSPSAPQNFNGIQSTSKEINN